MKSAAEVFQPLGADDPQVVAGYRLAARLGAGGMGQVYLSHTQGGRPVAIKVVRPELAGDASFRRRFHREVEAARRVRGAYTAELIDADAEGTPPWLATLYVPGPSLAEAVARRGPLPVPAVLWLVAGVAEALQVIHDAGIVHRDMKPSNVLLAADGPRVIDFGISLASGVTRHTTTGAAIGTPTYMAPEQASGDEVTAATDVFALGQTAAFAALGRPLYGDGPSLSVLYRIVNEAPDLEELPEALRPLIGLCLAADPADRATPAEIVEWCRKRLGADADDGAGPAVWQEVTGPEVEVPAPVADPTPVRTLSAPSSPWAPPQVTAPPAGPEEEKARRRRRALIAAVAVVGAVALGAGAWTVSNALDSSRGRSSAGAASDGAKPRASASSGPASGAPGTTAGTAKGSGGATTGGGASGPSQPRASAPGPVKPTAYTFQLLDDKKSVSLKEPTQREDATGDIRFTCNGRPADCQLESETSVLAPYVLGPGADLEKCRLVLTTARSRTLSLTAVAAGSEICVKHPSGDIALLVVQVKSTAAVPRVPGFLTADMTVWRAS
ncbi:protein kinase [Streptomyces sp. BR123]|uniref:serine/threonine-protein kinase n=1 Tax=Streptomyces sp. BR123 TaxID=2749828 RepID=UPI0015C4C5C3|nr:serine/threonine-protein kinase [Streptomyces sp. BR123]NXY94888.1 protein kinase [Streptomyces sp. BR123]